MTLGSSAAWAYTYDWSILLGVALMSLAPGLAAGLKVAPPSASSLTALRTAAAYSFCSTSALEAPCRRRAAAGGAGLGRKRRCSLRGWRAGQAASGAQAGAGPPGGTAPGRPAVPCQPTWCCSRYSATTPLTKGAAMEVPVLLALLLSEPITALSMSTPGAKMSTQAPLRGQGGARQACGAR